MYKLIISFLFLTLFILKTTATGCSFYSNCNDCSNNKQTNECIWCVTSGTCIEKKDISFCSVYEKLESKIEKEEIKANSPVNPYFSLLKLVYGKPIELTLTFDSSIPLDINFFFLTDTSGSMYDDMGNVKKVSTKLSVLLTNLCNGCSGKNVEELSSKLCKTKPNGEPAKLCLKAKLGGFIDKPFYSGNNNDPVDEFRPLKNFYSSQFIQVDPNDKRNPFFESINSDTGTHGNADLNEASFPAMMQAIKCSSWEENARHIMLVTTDDLSHVSGRYQFPFSKFGDKDSKQRFLIDETRRNPEVCYYDSSPIPSQWTREKEKKAREEIQATSILWEGPTSGQLKEALLSENIIPVFGISGESIKSFFEHFVDLLGFGKATTLDSSSSNILSAILESYNSITKSVRIITTNDIYGQWKYIKSISPETISVTTVDSKYFVKVTFLADEHSMDLDAENDKSILIKFIGVATSSIVVQKEICSCSGNITEVTNGVCTCGKCVCNEGFTGSRCECGDSSPLTCTINCGEADCVCGKCICSQPNYYLKDLKCCNDFNCPFGPNGELCSNNGKCECGECKCFDGYSGENCFCPIKKKSCEDNPCLNDGICHDSEDPRHCGFYCICQDGYNGEKCECKDCSENQNCNENGVKCNCDGSCECKKEYRKPDCLCLTTDPPSEECPEGTEYPCNNNGICNKCGKCECFQDFSGEKCECNNRPCQDSCYENSNNKCECGQCKCATDQSGNPIFLGPNCECPNEPCPVGIAGLTCSGKDRGECIYTKNKCATCQCFEGFGGKSCDCIKQLCSDDNGILCSGHGKCDTECGTCSCDKNYVNIDCSCSINDNPCKNNCSGHGTCHHGSLGCGKCLCEKGYIGDDCSCLINGCPIIEGKMCGENGLNCLECEGGCVCKPGYMQPSSSRGCICRDECDSINEKLCSGHGVCNNDVCGCTCDENYSGIACNYCLDETLINRTKCKGEYCKTELVTDDNCVECEEPICLERLCDKKSCNECSQIPKDLGCVWCGSLGKCLHKDEAQSECDKTKIGESCNAKRNNLIIIVLSSIFGFFFTIVACFLISKLIFMHLDKKEWERFNSFNMNNNFKESPMYENPTKTIDNLLSETE